MNQEKIFYNVVSIALEGNPSGMRMLAKKLAKLNDNVFPGWVAAYEYLASGAADGGINLRTPSAPPKSYSSHMPDIDLEQENMEQRGMRLIFKNEMEYPALLREIHDPPLALYVRGATLSKTASPYSPAITIVGTRRATPEGKVLARRFARELAQSGFAIVSGLALGIDAEAHEGCLEVAGETIAVLARGVDKVYPRENEKLGWRILEGGGSIISEYPPGEPPYPDRFLERNRIVSGLSEGTLVVEAPQRSGSLATANFALEQNRNVFVIPGPIANANFFGSHELIRQGAELVTKPEEILEAYGIDAKEKVARATIAATDEEKQILIALRDASHALEVDKIIELTKLEPRVVNQTLSFLLLKHLIKETKSGYIIE